MVKKGDDKFLLLSMFTATISSPGYGKFSPHDTHNQLHKENKPASEFDITLVGRFSTTFFDAGGTLSLPNTLQYGHKNYVQKSTLWVSINVSETRSFWFDYRNKLITKAFLNACLTSLIYKALSIFSRLVWSNIQYH